MGWERVVCAAEGDFGEQKGLQDQSDFGETERDFPGVTDSFLENFLIPLPNEKDAIINDFILQMGKPRQPPTHGHSASGDESASPPPPTQASGDTVG